MSNSKIMALFSKISNIKTNGEFQTFINELGPLLDQTDPDLHHKTLFGANTLNLDYSFKRLLMGCAINDQATQRMFLAATFYMLQRYIQSINIKLVLKWIEENVSYKAAINKSEKVYFEFANFCIKNQILKLISDEGIKKIIKESIIDACNRREITKLLSCVVVNNIDDIDFLQSISTFKSQGSFAEVALQLTVYKRIKELNLKSTSVDIKHLNEQLNKLFKIKYLGKVFDSMTDTLQSMNVADQPFYKDLSIFVSVNNKNLCIFISKLVELCKQTDKTKFSIKYASHSLLLLGALLESINCENFQDQTIDIIIVSIEQLRSKNQIVSSYAKILINNFIKTIDKRSSELLYKLSVKLYDLYDSNHGLFDHKLLTNIYKIVSVNKNDEKKITELLLSKINQSIERGDLVTFKFYVNEYSAALHNIKDEDIKIQQYQNLFDLYINFKDFADQFTVNAEITLKKSISIGVNLLYEKITEAIFKEQEIDILRRLATIWSKDNSELKEIVEAADSVKEETLSKLIYCTTFVNIGAETLDSQSITLKQIGDDMITFAQKFSANSVNSQDIEILVDCLIAILNIGNQSIRRLCGEVLKHFTNKMDEECFSIIETELFEQPVTELLDEEDEDGEDIVINGALL